MSDQELNRTQRFQKIQRDLSNFYGEKNIALVALARRLGATDTVIANALGIDQAVFLRKYGKRKDFK